MLTSQIYTKAFNYLRLFFVAASCLAIVSSISPAYAQNVTTMAGNNGLSGFAGDGGAATAAAARLSNPIDVLARADGSVLVTEQGNHRVRKVDVGGIITTFAGTTGGYSGDGFAATAAQLNNPASLVEDASGNIYIGTRGAIRKITPAGIISTIAGTGTAGNTGDGGLATAAQVNWVMGMRFDSAGNLFFTDYNSGVVRKIDTATPPIITKVAGTGTNAAFVADSVAALTEPLSQPCGILIEADGSLIVAVGGQHRIRKIIPGGNITTIVGTGTNASTGDNGPATAATLSSPFGLVSGGTGGYLVAELSGNRVRNIAANGIITTIIGNGSPTNTGDGGPASAATINRVTGLSFDRAGNLFINSYGSHVVRKISVPPPSGPSVFNAYVNTTTATLGTITPAGEQTVAYGGVVAMTVTANPRHVLRVSSNCEYVQTSKPAPLVPIGTGTITYDVTVNGPCQMEATFTPLIPTVNIASEAAANALFAATEKAQSYTTPTTVTQTASALGKSVAFKAWVTDIAGVPFPSATNVITFKANGTAIAGCSNVPLTLRASNVLHIREAVCTTSFVSAGNRIITSEFVGDAYNFPAASIGLNHSVSAAP